MMWVSFAQFLKNIEKRVNLPSSHVRVCVRVLIKIMRERILNDIPIIIDNFGTIQRKKLPILRRVYNVNKKEFRYIIPTSVIFIPNIAFESYLKDKDNKKFLRKKIIEKSKKLVKTIKKNKKAC